MASPLKNEAAWISVAKGRPLKVGPGPTPDPSENELVIKVAYAAVNPTDWAVRNNISSMCTIESYKCTLDARHSIC